MLNNAWNNVTAAIRWAFGWAPPWVVSALILLAAALAALALFRLVGRHIYRLAGHLSPFVQMLVGRSQGPVCAFLVLVAVGTALPTALFPYDTTISIAHLLLGGFVLVVGWTAIRALNLFAEIYTSRLRLDTEDNLRARKSITQVRILRGAAQTVLILLTLATALMTSDQVRQYGVSLFASAGAAGLVLGLAARPVLSNLLAGIQIALTQPIRVEDAVVVEGEWGWIENIGSTYVSIRLWDLRRLIVPLTYFIEKPFQNWTHESSDLIGSVFLHVDYSVPMDKLRAKLKEIVGKSPLWDGKVVVLQVTDTPNNLVELRALVSARNGSAAWDLRCEVREKMIAFLQAEYPDALPRQRNDLLRMPENFGAARAAPEGGPERRPEQGQERGQERAADGSGSWLRDGQRSAAAGPAAD